MKTNASKATQKKKVQPMKVRGKKKQPMKVPGKATQKKVQPQPVKATKKTKHKASANRGGMPTSAGPGYDGFGGWGSAKALLAENQRLKNQLNALKFAWKTFTNMVWSAQ